MKVKKYKASEIDKKVMYYEVDIIKRQNEIITLDKRYSEFSRLHQDLKKIFDNLPNFPSKTLFNISKNPEELMKRLIMLDKYLTVFQKFRFFHFLYVFSFHKGNYRKTRNFKL